MKSKSEKQTNKNHVIIKVTEVQVRAKARATGAKLAALRDNAVKAIDIMYKEAREMVKTPAPSGIGVHAAAYEAQKNIAAWYANEIFKCGASGSKTEKGVYDQIFKGLKDEGFIRAINPLKQDETTRKLDANRKAKARAIAKAKVEIKKAEPTRKFKEGELEELAMAHVADAKEVSKEEAKHAAAVASKLEGKTGFNVLTFPQECKEGKYSDGALPRSQAAFAAFLATFREEVKE